MIYKLESLRGVAAVCVIFYHSYFNFFDKKLSFFDNSSLFVDFFFILSGFVMTLAYKERIEKGFNFSTFFFLRVGRLYPLHFLMLMVWVFYIMAKQLLHAYYNIGSPQIYEGSDYNFFTFIMHLFLLNGMWTISEFVWNGPSWSISTEIFAYIVFYFFAKYKLTSSHCLLPLAISISFYTILSIDSSSIQPTLNGGFIRCLAGFFLGVFIYNFKSITNALNSNSRTVIELIVVFAVVISVAYSNKLEIQLLSVILMALSVIVFSSQNSGVIGRILESSFATNLGKWSFSIYMVHSLVISIHEVVLATFFDVTSANTTGFASFLINCSMLIVTITISKFTYENIELRFRNTAKAMVDRKVWT